MRDTSSPLARWMAGLALAAGLALPAPLFAQAVPKLPPQLPVPKAVPKPEVPEIARPLQPAPAGQAAAPAAPAAAPAGRTDGRDPFEPLVTKAPEGESRPSLSGLRLAGVVWDPVRRDLIRALVETPDGLGYYVRLNEEKFGGKVVAIERDRVRFSVREQDPSGQVRVRTVELKLN
ncbi:MAG: hypothetical protein HY359_07715 [Candidatus Rokubacteria bacterium]|nr:hypothetical protein [Candidatus Rokubacteria bacterium]